MSESSGSILQLQSQVTALSKVNLLIATTKAADLHKITSVLNAANISFTYDLYDLVTIKELEHDLFQGLYNAVLYDYDQVIDSNLASSLTEKLQWWCHFYANIPLILITDPLGDKRAVELIQSGVDGYVLRQELHKLPQILELTLFNSISKQTIARQQQERIQQQQERIQQLEAEKQNWLTKERLKQEHIAHLNHELRSPISSMLGFAGMLKEEYYGSLNAKQMQYVSASLSVGEYMLELVNNYLDLVKIEADKQILDLERLAVSEICQASLNLVRGKAKQKNLELIFDLGDNIDFCTADSIRLKQILVNLLNNAIKFTDQGSVSLKVKLKKNLLYFSVVDTGIGISLQDIAKLFKPFPQISKHHESTGLGLTLSKKLAQLHGGDISVTSRLDKGSCFTLKIPQYQLPIDHR